MHAFNLSLSLSEARGGHGRGRRKKIFFLAIAIDSIFFFASVFSFASVFLQSASRGCHPL